MDLAAPEQQKLIVDRLVDAIRDGILKGRYAPGQRLVEADITEEFGVSRGPVRVALGRLATEGLLEILPHRGARVKRYSEEEIVFVFQIREALEGMAARGAARNAGPSTTARTQISTLQRQMKEAIRDGRTDDYLKLNRAFHDVIIEAAANPLLTPIVRQLQTQALRTLAQAGMNIEKSRRSMADHAKIVQCILSGDEDGAESAMRAHVRGGLEEIILAIRRAQPEPLRKPKEQTG